MTPSVPPYEQVRREIVEQVRSGERRPGDRLPAIRALAGERGVAPGTVARAFSLLEEAGIVVSRRGAGTTIAEGALAASEAAAASVRRVEGAKVDEAVVALFAPPVARAREAGHDEATILAAVRAVLAESGGS